MARGGARPNSGRKARKSFAEMISDKDRAQFVEFMLSSYMGDMRLAVWIGNQLFGQAPQSIDHTTKGEALTVVISGPTAERYGGTTPSPDTDTDSAG